MIALSLSLAACLGWGVADFLGGLKSRHLPTLTVLVFSNLVGLGIIIAVVWLRGKPMPVDISLVWAVASGAAGVIVMFLLYKGLAVGAMSIVAPISATGVILPVTAGLVYGETLSPLQSVGITAAVFGTILAAREKGTGGEKGRIAAGAGYALGAAVATGLFFIMMDRASEADPYWATLFMRISFSLCLVPLVLAFKPDLKMDRSHHAGIIVLGCCNALASFAFAIATTLGMLSIVSVVSSLYPAVTVILSTSVLKERPSPIQFFGVILALFGIAFISAG